MCVQQLTKVDPYNGNMENVCPDVLYLNYNYSGKCRG